MSAVPDEAAEPSIVIDCRGQRCPLPVVALARQLVTVPIGAVIRVRADDPAAANDIPAWCRLRDQEFLGMIEVQGSTAFDVRRRS